MFVCKTENSHTGKDREKERQSITVRAELKRQGGSAVLLQHEAHERPDSDITQEAIRKLFI